MGLNSRLLIRESNEVNSMQEYSKNIDDYCMYSGDDLTFEKVHL